MITPYNKRKKELVVVVVEATMPMKVCDWSATATRVLFRSENAKLSNFFAVRQCSKHVGLMTDNKQAE